MAQRVRTRIAILRRIRRVTTANAIQNDKDNSLSLHDLRLPIAILAQLLHKERDTLRIRRLSALWVNAVAKRAGKQLHASLRPSRFNRLANRMFYASCRRAALLRHARIKQRCRPAQKPVVRIAHRYGTGKIIKPF